MKYLLLCYDDEQYWNEVGVCAHQDALKEAVKLTHELNDRGEYLLASPLQPVSTAISVRVRDGKPIVTNGPFAETREVLGGFYLIDVDNLDQALAIAGSSA